MHYVDVRRIVVIDAHHSRQMHVAIDRHMRFVEQRAAHDARLHLIVDNRLKRLRLRINQIRAARPVCIRHINAEIFAHGDH